MKAKNQKSVTLSVLIALSHLMSCQGHFLISLSNVQNEIYSYVINLLVVMSASVRFSQRKSSDGNVEESEVPSIIRDKYLWWEKRWIVDQVNRISSKWKHRYNPTWYGISNVTFITSLSSETWKLIIFYRTLNTILVTNTLYVKIEC